MAYQTNLYVLGENRNRITVHLTCFY